MKRTTVLFLLICVLALGFGCARHRAGSSFDINTAPSGTMQAIATDTANLLAADYPPGFTSIGITAPAKVGAFEAFLEDALRNKGFSVAGKSESNTLTLLYRLDELKSGGWYFNLQFAGKSLSRMYNDGRANGCLTQINTGSDSSGDSGFVDKITGKASKAGRDVVRGVNDVTGMGLDLKR